MGTKIKVTLAYPITDGETLTFRAAADAVNVDGLRVYYRKSGDDATIISKDFVFRDVKGSALTGMDIFTAGAYVTVSLDTTNNHAYVHNNGAGALRDLSNVILDKSVSKGAWAQGTGNSGWSDKKFFHKMCHGKGKFVVVANNAAAAYYSEDGIKWYGVAMPSPHSHDSGGNTAWSALSYGESPGVFVALVHGGSLPAISFDGIFWDRPNTLPSSDYWSGSAFRGNRCVIVSGGYDESADPWTTRTSSTVGILSFPEISGAGQNVVIWNTGTMPSARAWRDVAFGNGRFVAVAADSNVAAYSTGGYTWTEVALPSTGLWEKVAFGKGKFVAICRKDTLAASSTSNKAAYSEDGSTWTGATLPLSREWVDLTFADDRFIAVALTGEVAYSFDGITWTSETVNFGNKKWAAVAYGGGRLVLKNTYNSDSDQTGGDVVAYADLSYASSLLTQLEEAMAANPGRWKKILGISL